ncbi:MAG: sugar nucleotide-binding protein [Ignavibacteria bacterium]|nr:sugar nucleotide-binding protein [Ignavibacteria bacterium]
MKILITGGSGLLGQYLNTAFSSEFDILTLWHNSPGNCNQFNSLRVDLNDFSVLEEIIKQFSPDCIVHTAAIANPLKALAMDPAQVFRTNVALTEFIARQAEQRKAKLIYTSTDMVYAGYRGTCLTEEAKLVPMSLYAETKLLGEIKIKQVTENYVILRTALLIGQGLTHTTNSFQEMVKSLSQGEKVDVFVDQTRSPLVLSEAARIIREILRLEIAGATLNFAGAQKITRAELGELVCKAGGFPYDLLNKISMKDKPGTTIIEDISLDVSRLQSLGIIFESLEEGVFREVKNISTMLQKEK